MTIANALSQYANMLSAKSGETITVGEPYDTAQGIFLWPYRLEEDAASKNLPALTSSAVRQGSIPYLLHFLVMVRPAINDQGISRLEKIHQAIVNNPVLVVEPDTAHVGLNTLAQEQLSSLFVAARIPLTLCISATMRYKDVMDSPPDQAELAVASKKDIFRGVRKDKIR